MPQQHPLPALKRALGTEREHLRPGARPVVVIGVGNELRSDDGVGICVARDLAAASLPNVYAIRGGSAPENSTGEIRGHNPSHVLIVDAADLHEPPGSISILDPDTIGGASFATHGLPLSVLGNYLRTEIGCQIIFVGIQPASLAFGESLTPTVQHAARELVAALTECLGSG